MCVDFFVNVKTIYIFVQWSHPKVADDGLVLIKKTAR